MSKPSSISLQWEKRLPVRLHDYEIGNVNEIFDEEVVNFVLFANYDPMIFEEALRNDHWNSYHWSRDSRYWENNT